MNPFASSTTSSPDSKSQTETDNDEFSDPSVIIIFKNFNKRDATTRVKALNDFIPILETQKQVEDAVLHAWVIAYGRLSSDVSRRIRILAQDIQGRLCKSAGKRVAIYMKQMIGPFLISLYDVDRAVRTHAQQAFDAIFTTQEKRSQAWQVYHEQVLEYLLDIIFRKTPETFSELGD